MNQDDKNKAKNSIEKDALFWPDCNLGDRVLRENAKASLAIHFQELKTVHKLLKANDGDDLPEDGQYYQGLHDRIMERVKSTQMEPVVWARKKKIRALHDA